ncbi:MAG: thymidine phosphorylase [Exilibacterium sp.]
MLAQEIIRAKREGLTLSDQQITDFIEGMVEQSVTEGQVAALAMAIFFKGLQHDECIALTRALQLSGSSLDWRGMDLNGPVVDKHSTGGVGDKVSLMLAPMLAACGAYVPMISGRGLGHTGGTLDKMDSIPGYNTSPDIDRFQRVVKQCGCAIVGQTAQLAPADKRLYSIRDVTATVESVPLITASILSKKLSAGLDSLVMDIKTGSGAFAASHSMARELGTNIVEVGEGLGLSISALITDMSQVLGTNAGNALEVAEVVHYLSGEFRDPRLHAVVIALGAELLVLSNIHSDLKTAEYQLQKVLENGDAAEFFGHMIYALGGPKDFIDKPDDYLTAAPVTVPFFADIAEGREKALASIDVRALGNAIVELGGGRRRPQDKVNHAVGLSAVKGLGEKVDNGEPLAIVHAASRADADKALARLRDAYIFSDSTEMPGPAIVQRLTSLGAG